MCDIMMSPLLYTMWEKKTAGERKKNVKRKENYESNLVWGCNLCEPRWNISMKQSNVDDFLLKYFEYCYSIHICFRYQIFSNYCDYYWYRCLLILIHLHLHCCFVREKKSKKNVIKWKLVQLKTKPSQDCSYLGISGIVMYWRPFSVK